MTDSGRAVFLSYASQDAAAAQQLCNALRAAGVEVWLDQSELRGGDAWDALIRRQIKSCYLFVAIISANTQSREEGYFRREWSLAVARTLDMAEDRAFLLPVVIDATSDADARVPEKFREVHWTRLPSGASTAAFVAHVRRLLSPAATAPASATAPAAVAARAAASAAAKASSVRRSSPVPWIVAALLVIAIGYVAIDRVLSVKHASMSADAVSNQSVAVLPFADMSAAKDQEYFADGMAEEIINSLANIETLKVAGRTSSFSFKGKTVDLKTIGETLGVANVLEGSVRKQGDHVRITAQLVRAKDGFHVWSNSYDGTLADIFDLQEHIAREITTKLKVVLTSGEGRLVAKATDNPEAYTLFIEAQGLVNRRADLSRAIDLLNRATTLDPKFSRAWSTLAIAEVVAPQYSDVPWNAGWSAGETAARHALAIDPDDSGSYAALGYMYLSQRHYSEMHEAFEHALALNANDPTALYWSANGLASMGQSRAAEQTTDRILVSDPVNAIALLYKSLLAYSRGSVSETQQYARATIAQGLRSGHVAASLADAAVGDYDAATTHFATGWQFNASFSEAELATIYRGTYGNAANRVAALATVERHQEADLAPSMYLLLSEPAQAFARFERGKTGISDSFFLLLWQPADYSRRARKDPSFQPFAKRLGMIDYWQKYGWPDLCHPTPTRGPDAFDCD